MKNEQLNKNSLLDYLQQVPKERPFLILRESKYTFGDVVALYYRLKSEYGYLADKNCAIVSKDRASLALYLPVIDGMCKSIFLQPTDIIDNDSEFYQSGFIDYIISLENTSITSVKKVINVNKSDLNLSHKRYLLATSGTTGTPKLASYTLNALLSTAKNNISKGAGFIWGLSYDINRFAGLQVYLQSIASGSALAIPDPLFSIKNTVDFFIRENINCLSATPSFWRKLLMVPDHRDIPFKRITLGGEISNQSILSALTSSFPQSTIVHIYASTEVGVGFAVKDWLEGFPIDFLDNPSIINCHLIVKDGLLWVKSSNGCSGFLKGKLDIDSDGFVDTGDMVQIVNNRVVFLGRASGSINVGGNKVMPEKVESVLESHDAIVMAKVFPKNNSVLGSLIVSEVTLNKSIDVELAKKLKKEILLFCREKLEPFEVPALIKFVDSIATNATGKKVRNS
ncbi:AMP-binding protein [Vibrio cyclitrophicus]|uniref:AMP-binding protein n=1 Tax=Vibrio cyclitrophicus TaxID=47951 RepID=UPI003999737A